MVRDRSAAGNSPEREHRVTALHGADRFTVKIENIGGITHEKRTLPVGVTPLVGANATKRSSFINGVMAGLGSDSDTITVNTAADKGEGRVDLTVNGETFTRTVRATTDGSGRVLNGAPVVDDPAAAEKLDLYAFLHGDNEVRNVIESNGDVYDVLMRPVDTNWIEDRISDIKGRKAEIENALASIEDAKDEFVNVENTIDKTEAEKDELVEQRDELEDEISELEAELEAARESDKKSDAEQRLETLEDEIDELENKKRGIKKKINAREESKAEIELKLTELMGPATKTKSINEIDDKLDVIDSKIQDVNDSVDRLRDAKKDIDELFEIAKSIRDKHGTFETILDELADDSIPDGPVTFTERDGDRVSDTIRDSDVTAGLMDTDGEVDTDTSQCLVCGQETGEKQIKDVVDQYRIVRRELQDRITGVKDEKKKLKKQRDELQSEKEQIREVEQERNDLETKKTDIIEKLDELRDERDRVESELADARSERDSISLSDDGDGDKERDVQRIQNVLKKKRDERRRVDRELGSEMDDLDRLETRREELEERIDEEDDLEAEYDELDAEHESLLNRVEQKETDLVDQFNNHMETVIEAFGYTNLERIWIDRNTSDTKDTRAKDNDFNVHIVREDDDGKTNESRLAHLSESERAVTGILFAVTGYIVHNVADICPVMILDSIEMIDGERVAALLSFLDREVGSRWTIAALLPDHMTDVTDDVVTGTERFTETGDVTLQ